MPVSRLICQNTAVLGLKNEGRQGPLNRVWFFPVVYLFEERSAMQRVVIEVVFYGESEKGVLAGIRGDPVAERGRARRSCAKRATRAAINRLAKYNCTRTFLLT